MGEGETTRNRPLLWGPSLTRPNSQDIRDSSATALQPCSLLSASQTKWEISPQTQGRKVKSVTSGSSSQRKPKEFVISRGRVEGAFSESAGLPEDGSTSRLQSDRETFRLDLLLHSLLLPLQVFHLLCLKRKTPLGSSKASGEPFRLRVPVNCGIPVAGLHQKMEVILSCG